MNLKNIFFRFKWQISFTLSIVILEGFLFVLFPLFIGKAIDSAIAKEMTGIFYLGGLCVIALIIGAGRRFYDTRIYAKMYQKLAEEISSLRKEKKTSENVAHINLLTEVVSFFENSLPELFANIIGLVGTLVIIATLSLNVFTGCLICMLIIFLIYWLSSKKTLHYNNSYNNEYEKQVEIHEQNNEDDRKLHYKSLMKWKIRLSDLETLNFSGVWMILCVLLCYSVVDVVDQKGLVYGVVFSIIMYVFQFMESTINLPFFYQQTLRLKDISIRIEKALE